MNYKVQWTSKFKKDYKLCQSRGYDINLLDEVILLLAKGKNLPKKYKDHNLTGQWKDFREMPHQTRLAIDLLNRK